MKVPPYRLRILRPRNRGGGYKRHVLVGGSKVFVVDSKVLVVGNKFSWEATGTRGR